jgi:hypothetical protein
VRTALLGHVRLGSRFCAEAGVSLLHLQDLLTVEGDEGDFARGCP